MIPPNTAISVKMLEQPTPLDALSHSELRRRAG
jgi:hypothetical protein